MQEPSKGDLVYFYNLGLGEIIGVSEKALKVRTYVMKSVFWFPKILIVTYNFFESEDAPRIPEQDDTTLPVVTLFIEIAHWFVKENKLSRHFGNLNH